MVFRGAQKAGTITQHPGRRHGTIGYKRKRFLANLHAAPLMEPATTKTRRTVTWILFTGFLFTVPVPFFMLVVGGIVPLVYILYLSIQGLVVAIPKFTAEGFWMLGILWAHVATLGGILYLGALGISWLLCRIFPERYALLLLIGLVVALCVASTQKIYRMPGHNSSPPANIVRVMSSLIE